MEIILSTNEYGYVPFLHTNVSSFIIGFKDFCINQKFCLSKKELQKAINDIHSVNKKIYLNLNLFAKENKIKKLSKIVESLKDLNIDGFIVSDLGILNIFKNKNLENKVILDLHTYVTNKYSAKSLLNIGVNRVCLSKEITLNDIKEISSYTNSKIEVFGQGYIPITYSNRNILNCYYKKYKLKNDKKLHYLKEESRENFYLTEENNDTLIVYNDKQYSLFSYLPDLVEYKINYLRIDANFLSIKEINDYISFYSEGIKTIQNNNIEKFNELKEKFNKTYIYDTPFLHNESFLLKEGN